MILARFYVAETTRTAYGAQKNPDAPTGKVVLQAVSRGAQNAQWSEATPMGRIEMTVNNPAGFAAFEAALGLDCDITITPIPKAVQGDDGHAFEPTPDLGQSWPAAGTSCAVCGCPESVHTA